MKTVEETSIISDCRFLFKSVLMSHIDHSLCNSRKQTKPRIRLLSLTKWACLYHGVVWFGRTASMPPDGGWILESTAILLNWQSGSLVCGVVDSRYLESQNAKRGRSTTTISYHGMMLHGHQQHGTLPARVVTKRRGVSRFFPNAPRSPDYRMI